MKTQFDKSRVVNVYSPNVPPFKLTLNYKTSFNDIRNHIIQAWSLVPKRVRIFNQNGHELSEQDLQFVLDGNKLYITLFGQDLDAGIIFQEYEIISEIGKGGQGTVLLGRHKFVGTFVALKITKDSEEDDSLRESKILKDLIHRNIVKVFQTLYFPKNKECIMIMEYLEGGSLLQLIRSIISNIVEKGTLPESEVKIYVKQIIEALLFCHSKNIVHRDLKLENIMIVSEDSWVKLIDFGLAGLTGTQREQETMNVGTLPYMPPEALNGKLKLVSPCVDVWGVGVIIYSLIYGKLPFKGRTSDEKVSSILLCNYQHETNVSEDVKDLLNRIFVPKHNQRISLLEIFTHKWVGGSGLLQFRRLLKKTENPYLKNSNKKYDFEIRKRSVYDDHKEKVRISLPIIRYRAISQETLEI